MSVGAACQEDQFGRAIAGQLNLNPQVIPTSPLGWEQFTAIETQLDYLVPPAQRQIVYSILHEFIHLLGFTANKFFVRLLISFHKGKNHLSHCNVFFLTKLLHFKLQDFRSQTNLSAVLNINSTLSVTVPLIGPTVYKVITPNVIAQARQHFDCGNIDGMISFCVGE
jgi:hypothetical protein